jgi:hypothetical protein
MRRIVAVVALLAISASTFAASPRKEMYTKQLTCTLQQTLALAAAPAAQPEANIVKAAESCVKPEDMSVGYKGFVKYEDRAPETVKKELDERRVFMVKATARQINRCRKAGIPSDKLVTDCVISQKPRPDESAAEAPR